MTLLLDLALIPKTHRLVTDQGIEETKSQFSQEEITEFTRGNNTIQCPLYNT